jgi:hypothetical protein
MWEAIKDISIVIVKEGLLPFGMAIYIGISHIFGIAIFKLALEIINYFRKELDKAVDRIRYLEDKN